MTRINENIYRKWTNRNVWALGLLMADGTFDRRKNRTARFGVYNTEYEIVKEFKNVFESENKIVCIKNRKNSYGIKKKWKVFMTSKKLNKYFSRINALGTKDERNPFPFIPDNYKWAFIRGLFDGDGNFYKGRFSIAGRNPLIMQVYYWICLQLNKTPNKIYGSSNTDKTKYFMFSSDDSFRILQLIKKNTKGVHKSKKYKKWERYFSEELEAVAL